VGFLALLAAAAGLLALAQRKASRRRTIVVRRGDTLWSLAERYLGSSKRWRELLERNPELADHPDILFPQDAVHVR
jgi:nucleoid-associated protein YgaU